VENFKDIDESLQVWFLHSRPSFQLKFKNSLISRCIFQAFSKNDQVVEAFCKIQAEFSEKPVDILVHSAADFTGLHAFGTETSDGLDAGFNFSIKGAYFVAAAFMEKASPDATIINIAAATVHVQPFPKVVSYTAAKSAAIKIFLYAQAEHPTKHLVRRLNS
jgi:hypothetical protein